MAIPSTIILIGPERVGKKHGRPMRQQVELAFD